MLEDTHLADASSLELTGYVARRIDTPSALVLADLRPSSFGGSNNTDAWTLEPLDRNLPDAIRAEYGVPPLAEHSKRVEELYR